MVAHHDGDGIDLQRAGCPPGRRSLGTFDRGTGRRREKAFCKQAGKVSPTGWSSMVGSRVYGYWDGYGANGHGGVALIYGRMEKQSRRPITEWIFLVCTKSASIRIQSKEDERWWQPMVATNDGRMKQPVHVEDCSKRSQAPSMEGHGWAPKTKTKTKTVGRSYLKESNHVHNIKGG